MTRDEFMELLADNQIDPNIVRFDDGTSDGYCVRKTRFRWETLVRERGMEYDVLGYPSESDALTKLSEDLIRIYSKIKK